MANLENLAAVDAKESGINKGAMPARESLLSEYLDSARGASGNTVFQKKDSQELSGSASQVYLPPIKDITDVDDDKDSQPDSAGKLPDKFDGKNSESREGKDSTEGEFDFLDISPLQTNLNQIQDKFKEANGNLQEQSKQIINEMTLKKAMELIGTPSPQWRPSNTENRDSTGI